MADGNPDLTKTLRFWPQDGIGEGQFVAVLQKVGKARIEKKEQKQKKPSVIRGA